MNVLNVRNVHAALPLMMQLLKDNGTVRDSRNGRVLQFDAPTTVVYEKPTERVMFWEDRDCNPFFHLFESAWMLGGRRDVTSPTRFVKNFASYSDDGQTYHGAYGHRWRVAMPADVQNGTHSPFDQLQTIIDNLRQNGDDRRCVLQFWDSASDLGNPSKDLPCNISATFQIKAHGLDLCVFNRSNDLVLGMLGANAVHLSYLHEYVARRVGVAVGHYWQISANVHGYDKTFQPLYEKLLVTAQGGAPEGTVEDLTPIIECPSPYELTPAIRPYPLMQEGTDPVAWERSLSRVLAAQGRAPTEGGTWADPWFADVLVPMLRSHDAYKDQSAPARFDAAIKEALKCRATDWAKAAVDWITRRQVKWQHDNDDGPIPQ